MADATPQTPQVFSQDLTALDPVPSCSVEWVGQGIHLAQWDDSKADLSLPYLVSSQHLFIHDGVQVSPAFPSA